MDELAVIDVAPLVGGVGRTRVDPGERDAAEAIDRACRAHGVFLVTGHGVGDVLLDELDAAARRFFALPEEVKAEIAMPVGRRAWRGWFPEGGELTSGRPDRKEGVYFGRDLAPDHPAVQAGTPLHGPNLRAAAVPELLPAVHRWMEAVEAVGHAVVRGMALGLGLAPIWFDDHLTGDPTVLFRIFRYPAGDDGWGVGEHTDYGLVTILAHDGTPGLEVRAPDGSWVAVPTVPGAFVVNLGDMLERMTAGAYRSTPHRVRPATAGRDRLSFPFFFDPAWGAEVRPVPGLGAGDAAPSPARWDGASVHEWSGTYGEYLLAKVARVFPALAAELDG
ncbi:MAG: 2-oxoglutarate and iron-dependent oxygenase domain-containing protein [Acidimicrobiales bacterium]